LWLALALLAACGCPDDELPLAVIGVASSLEVCAEVADTEEERRQGLMGHAPLGPGEGMYFDFPVEQEICFYNAGVDFSIDILFATGRGVVVGRALVAPGAVEAEPEHQAAEQQAANEPAAERSHHSSSRASGGAVTPLSMSMCWPRRARRNSLGW